MRIGLLAPQENGKTSYFVALYSVLTQDKPEALSYPVNYTVKNKVQQERLDTQYQNLCNKRLPKSERFPEKTRNTHVEYEFEAQDRTSREKHEIVVVDFPGELLRGGNNETLKAHENAMAALKTCDAFIVVLDAEYLTSDDRSESKSRLSPGHINSLLDGVLHSERKEFSALGVPVAFCVSKLDLLGKLNVDQRPTLEKAYKRIRQMFPSFFHEQHRHPVLIGGVSLGQTIAGKPGEEKDDAKLGGPFEPFFIDTPFEFCVGFCSLSAAKHNQASEERWERDRRNFEADAQRAKGQDWWETFQEWWKCGATIGESPEEYYQKEAGRKNDVEMFYYRKSRVYHTVGFGLTESIRKNANINQLYDIFCRGRARLQGGA